MSFAPSHYFEPPVFPLAPLFDENEFVWEALKKIGNYLHSLPLGMHLGTVDPGAYLVHPELIFIGKGSVIEPGAYIKGPCYIGENCQIRHGAYLRGNVLTGSKCVIGHATEVKNSIFFDGAQAGHFAYVGDSILGRHVNLGAGTKCANLRFDNQTVQIVWEGRRIDTGLRKFGAILGDGVLTGCNSVTNPGTLMGKQSCLTPCTTAHGVIPKNSVVKAPESVIIPSHH